MGKEYRGGNETSMTFSDFDTFQDVLLNEVVRMKNTKGKEYANSNDRFANFNRLSNELGLANYVVAYVYLKKHLDSIASYIEK